MRQEARTALGQMVNVQAAADQQQADQVLVHGIHLSRLCPLPPAQVNRTESFLSDSAAVNVPRGSGSGSGFGWLQTLLLPAPALPDI